MICYKSKAEMAEFFGVPEDALVEGDSMVVTFADVPKHPLPEVTNWQPIETAPKDGTPILVYEPPRPGRPPSGDDFSLVKWFAYRDTGEWALAECGTHAEDGYPMNGNPTHWMRLTPPEWLTRAR